MSDSFNTVDLKEWHCPSVPWRSGQSTVQIYSAIYNNNQNGSADRSKVLGINLRNPLIDRYTRVLDSGSFTIKKIPNSLRVLFIDACQIDSTSKKPFSFPVFQAYPRDSEPSSYTRPSNLHAGTINLVSWLGAVETIRPEKLSDYYAAMNSDAAFVYLSKIVVYRDAQSGYDVKTLSY